MTDAPARRRTGKAYVLVSTPADRTGNDGLMCPVHGPVAGLAFDPGTGDGALTGIPMGEAVSDEFEVLTWTPDARWLVVEVEG